MNMPATGSGDRPVVRALSRQDYDAVLDLLIDLPKLYPGAEEWLEQKLRANTGFWVLDLDGEIVGTLVETLKPNNVIKLANIYVAPGYRGQGYGQMLVSAAVERWVAAGASLVYATVDASNLDGLLAVLGTYGFEVVAAEHGRYRSSATEYVVSVDGETLAGLANQSRTTNPVSGSSS